LFFQLKTRKWMIPPKLYNNYTMEEATNIGD